MIALARLMIALALHAAAQARRLGGYGDTTLQPGSGAAGEQRDCDKTNDPWVALLTALSTQR